jgi:hypothetical protein
MANLITHIHPMGTADAKARDLALGRIQDSIDAFGGQNAILRQMNRYYHSISPTRVRTSENDVPISRNSRLNDSRDEVFVPMSFALVVSAVPHWMFNLFGQKPHLKFLGRTFDDHQKSEAVTKAIDYQMERGTVFLQSIPIALSTYKYGTGIGKVGYRYKSHMHTEKFRGDVITGFDPLSGKAVWGKKTITERTPIVDFDGPWIDPVSVFLWHPDPLYWRPDDMRFTGESRWTDIQTLRKLDQQYYELTDGKHMYTNLDKIPKMSRHKIGTSLQMDSSDDTAEAMGWNVSPHWSAHGQGRWRGIQDAEENADQVILVKEYWEDDQLIEVANEEIVIRRGENPHEDKKKPYIVSTCFPIEFSVWGMGYLHPTRKTQELLNSWRKLTLKQGRYNVHNVWAVPENTDMDIDEFEPNKIYEVPYGANDKPLVTQLMDGKPLPPEAQYIEGALMADAQRALSAPDWSAGAIEGAKTATEAKLQGESSASKLRLQGAIGEIAFLQPMGEKFLSRMKQYGSEEQIFRVVGKDGSVEFSQITRQDLAGAFDMEAQGGLWHPNVDVIRQQMLEALAVARGDPVMLEISDVYEIWKELWKLFPGIRSPERFVKPPAEKTWDAPKENIILSAGEAVIVTANEAHDQHYQEHMKGLTKAVAEKNDRAIAQYSEHLQRHQFYLQQQKSMTPNQEMPGLSGEAGNLPQDGGLPTQGNILAKVNGGVGV